MDKNEWYSELDKALKEIIKDPKKGEKILIEAGIMTKAGKLAKRYKPVEYGSKDELATYKKLKDEFDVKVKKLQETCPHKRTRWCEEWWAIAHSTGFKVKICLRCNKKLDKKQVQSETKQKKQLKSAASRIRTGA